MSGWDDILKNCVVNDSLEFNMNVAPGSLYFISDVHNGNIIEKRRLEDDHGNMLPVNGLNTGIYRLTVIDGDNVYNTKFEKK